MFVAKKLICQSVRKYQNHVCVTFKKMIVSSFPEMLRTKAVQERAKVRQADPEQPQVPGAWGDLGHEGAHPKLPGQEGGSLRLCQVRQ